MIEEQSPGSVDSPILVNAPPVHTDQALLLLLGCSSWITAPHPLVLLPRETLPDIELHLHFGTANYLSLDPSLPSSTIISSTVSLPVVELSLCTPLASSSHPGLLQSVKSLAVSISPTRNGNKSKSKYLPDFCTNSGSPAAPDPSLAASSFRSGVVLRPS
ncbi:uncharacterized protein LOC144703515 [Wolffia australiana]